MFKEASPIAPAASAINKVSTITYSESPRDAKIFLSV